MDIAVFVPENAVIESITPAYRTFRTANDFLSAAGRKPVFNVFYTGLSDVVSTNDNEYMVRVDVHLKDVQLADLLILPALYGNIETALAANASAIPHIQRLHARGASVASLCIGAFLLAASGLANGKKCSTHWAYCDALQQMFPAVDVADGAVITDEGNIYSSGGANSQWNLILYLVEKFSDRETAVLVSKYFAIDIDRSTQAIFTIFKGQKSHTDKEILEMQSFIENNYAEKFTIGDLARKVNVSKRTFERRFKQATANNPNEYVQRVRMEAAKKYFEASRKNVSEVMYDVGYADTKAFRDVFKKITGVTPMEYRKKFAGRHQMIEKAENFH